MKFRINLQKKAILIVAGIVFFILGINTAVLTYMTYERYRSAILSKTAAIGEGLQSEMGKVLALGVPIDSFDGLNEKLEDLISRDKAIAYAMVVNTSAKILFSSEPARIGNLADKETSQKNTLSKEMLIQTVDSYYELSFPLLNPEDAVVGALRIGVHSTAINTQLYRLLSWSLIISLLCFLASLLLVYFAISKFITTPILKMEKVADRIASGNLTAAIDVTGTDEIASLGNAINRMAFNLKDMLSKLSNISNSVSQVTENVSRASIDVLNSTDIQKKAIDETASSVDEMNHSISQIAQSSESLSESARDTSSSIIETKSSSETIAEHANVFSETANETASSIEEMVSTIKQIAESIETLSASSTEIASSIEEVNATTKDIEKSAGESVLLAAAVMDKASDKGMTAFNTAMEGMEIIKKSVSALSDVINMLGKRTNDIGKVLNVIDNVADQTNLLSLNAAILASKAGEHGRGFAVVADQIKDLAERTTLSTSEISALIKSVQDETQSSISMASEGIEAVDKGMILVHDVNDALSEIIEGSRVSTEMAKSIQRATAEESVVIKQITSAIESMKEQTENISRALREQSKGSSFILEESEKVKDLSQQVRNATREQKEVSSRIASVMENVTRQASQIAISTNRQKEKSTDIVRSMEQISSTTDKLKSSSTAMSAVISSLKEEALNLLSVMEKFKV